MGQSRRPNRRWACQTTARASGSGAHRMNRPPCSGRRSRRWPLQMIETTPAPSSCTETIRNRLIGAAQDGGRTPDRPGHTAVPTRSSSTTAGPGDGRRRGPVGDLAGEREDEGEIGADGASVHHVRQRQLPSRLCAYEVMPRRRSRASRRCRRGRRRGLSHQQRPGAAAAPRSWSRPCVADRDEHAVRGDEEQRRGPESGVPCDEPVGADGAVQGGDRATSRTVMSIRYAGDQTRQRAGSPWPGLEGRRATRRSRR